MVDVTMAADFPRTVAVRELAELKLSLEFDGKSENGEHTRVQLAPLVN